MTTTITRQDCLVLPYVATTERKAEMFATAIEMLIWPHVETEVFQDGGKWAVAVVEGMEHIGNPDENQSILAAFTLLLRFDFAESTGDMDTIGVTLEESANNQEALTLRARRTFRIENKLDAILTALVGNEGAKAPEGSGSESPRPEPATT